MKIPDGFYDVRLPHKFVVALQVLQELLETKWEQNSEKFPVYCQEVDAGIAQHQ